MSLFHVIVVQQYLSLQPRFAETVPSSWLICLICFTVHLVYFELLFRIGTQVAILSTRTSLDRDRATSPCPVWLQHQSYPLSSPFFSTLQLQLYSPSSPFSSALPSSIIRQQRRFQLALEPEMARRLHSGLYQHAPTTRLRRPAGLSKETRHFSRIQKQF